MLDTATPALVTLDRCPLCRSTNRRFVLGSWRDEIALARCGSCDLVHATGRYDTGFLNDDVYGYQGPAVSSVQLGRKRKSIQTYDRLLSGRLLDGAAGSRVLDIGCNTGAMLDAFRSYGFETEGIERSAGAARTARRQHRVYEVDVTSPGLELGRLFDVITLSHVLEHIERPAAALRFIARHLAPGGVVIIEVPNWNDATRRLWGRRYRPLELGDHGAFYDRDTLGRAVDAAGMHTMCQWSGVQTAALVIPNVLTAADLALAVAKRARSKLPSVADARANAHRAPRLIRRAILSALDALDPWLERALGQGIDYGPNLITIAAKSGMASH